MSKMTITNCRYNSLYHADVFIICDTRFIQDLQYNVAINLLMQRRIQMLYKAMVWLLWRVIKMTSPTLKERYTSYPNTG